MQLVIFVSFWNYTLLKVVFSNMNALAVYLQNKQLDIATAKITAEATVVTLKKCRNPDGFLRCMAGCLSSRSDTRK